MHLLISESSKVLNDEEWEDDMSCGIEGLTSDRRLRPEWSAITTAVRKADGITDSIPGNYNHISKDVLKVSNRH